MINETKLEKRLEFAFNKSNDMPRAEGNKYLAKTIASLIKDALGEVIVVIPKNKVIVENQHGQFEKVVSAIQGYLEI